MVLKELHVSHMYLSLLNLNWPQAKDRLTAEKMAKFSTIVPQMIHIP
jgi:hypothetical protein